MTVVIETDFVGIDYNLNHPRIAWRRAGGAVTASSSADGFAAVNAGTPRTDTAWRPTGATGTWTITPASSDGVSYLGVAGHDFGTQAATVKVQVDIGAGFVDVPGCEVSPDDNEPLLFLFEARDCDAVRLSITAADAPPTVAVIAAGLVSEWPRFATWIGTPITESEQISFANNSSDTGNWLGRTKTADGLSFDVQIDNLPESYRQGEFKEFKAHANGDVATFFVATRPYDYPDEVSYAWVTDTLRMSREIPNRRVSGSVRMQCRGYRKL